MVRRRSNVLIYFGIVFIIFIFFAIINLKVKYKTKFWQRFIVIIFIYFFAFIVISIFPRLLTFDEKFPLHTDWKYVETIKNEDALIYIYNINNDEETPSYTAMVFQKVGFLVMPWPGYDYLLDNFEIYKYAGEDNTYQDIKAHTIVYKIGNEKYLICLEIYDGQALTVTNVNYNNQSVDFQLSEADPNMVFFVSDELSNDLVINDLQFEHW